MGGVLALTIELGIVYWVIWVCPCFCFAFCAKPLNRNLGTRRRWHGHDESVAGCDRRPGHCVRGDCIQPDAFRARILGVRPGRADATHSKFVAAQRSPLKVLPGDRQALYPVLLVIVIALNKLPHFERDREGFERISDTLRGGEPRSSTQWRRKFLLSTPPPALVDQRASRAGAEPEVFALSHKRTPSGWDEGDTTSLGKGEIL